MGKNKLYESFRPFVRFYPSFVVLFVPMLDFTHGSSKKKEKSPDGSRDENVFDIQQGVAISIFVKAPN